MGRVRHGESILHGWKTESYLLNLQVLCRVDQVYELRRSRCVGSESAVDAAGRRNMTLSLTFQAVSVSKQDQAGTLGHLK